MKNLICIILICLFSFTGYKVTAGKIYLTNQPTLDSTVATNADSSRNTFSVGLIAGNNSYFFGRSTDIPYPYLSGNFSYKLTSGFWVATTLYHIKGVKNYVDETNLSAGWDFNITNRLNGSISYTRYIYGSDNPLLQSVASNLATAQLAYDWSFLYSSLTANYLFGEFNDVILALNNSRYIEKKNIFGSNDYLGFDPAINLLAGTQYFTRDYTIKVENEAAANGNNGNGNGNNGNGNNGNGNGNTGNNGNGNGNAGNGNNGNGNGNNGNGNNGNGNGNAGNGNNGNGNNGNNGNGTGNGNSGNTGNGNSGNGNSGGTTTTTTTVVESKFTLLNYGLTVPVIYGFGSNSFELSYRLLVPTNVPAEFSTKPRSFFTFSYYHSF